MYVFFKNTLSLIQIQNNDIAALIAEHFLGKSHIWHVWSNILNYIGSNYFCLIQMVQIFLLTKTQGLSCV